MATARSEVQSDDQRVRVTRWAFAEGDETGHHRHEFNYVVVPVTGGTFRIVGADGAAADRVQEAGVSYPGHAGAEHNVINASGHDAVFVEIELKRSA